MTENSEHPPNDVSDIKMASQKNMFDFFDLKSKSPANPRSIVKPIVDDIICSVFLSKAKRHDGNKVSEKTIKSWEKGFPWLKVCRETESKAGMSLVRLKCSLCCDQKQKTVWATDGTTNIQKSAIERHCESEPHIEATKLSMLENKTAPDCSQTLDDSKTTDVNVSDSDVFLMRTVYMVMKEELPIDKVNSILELQRLNKVDIPYQNLSWTTLTELQNIIASSIKQELLNKLKQSEFFAVLIDESTDITISKRLSICVRYVNAGTPETTFLGNVELSDGCAHTITETLIHYLKECCIDITRCVSLATDGASVMMGRKTGVGVQFQAKAAPFMVQTHCVAHRLNLAVTDSIKKVDTLVKFNLKFEQLYHYISASANRTYTLKQMQKLLEEPELTVKQPYSIRWLGLKRAVEAVYDCYGSILATLSKLADGDSKAKGLYKYFSHYKTALLLGLMVDIHGVLGNLSCQLQQASLIFSDVPAMIDSTVSNLEFLTTHDGNGLVEMKASIETKDEKAFYKGDELSCFSENVNSQFDTVKREYLGNLVKNIRKRIPKNDSRVMSSLSQLLEPCVVNVASRNQTEDALQTIISHYGHDKVVKHTEGDLLCGVEVNETSVEKYVDAPKIAAEWPCVLGMIKGTYRNLSLQDLCMRLLLKHREAFPNMAKLASIALCMEVTSVECERTFSAQNRLKNKFRSSLGNQAMEGLMRVGVCGPDVRTFNAAACARQWLGKKRRKKRLMADFKPRAKKQKTLSCSVNC